jgi:hypothetical protein
MNGYREGFKEGSGIERDMIWDSEWKAVRMNFSSGILYSLVTPHSRVVDPFLKGSLEMWYALCATSESHPLAQIITSFPTNSALAT